MDLSQPLIEDLSNSFVPDSLLKNYANLYKLIDPPKNNFVAPKKDESETKDVVKNKTKKKIIFDRIRQT